MERQRVFIVGVGMTKFIKPREGNPDYPILAKQAVQRALNDAAIPYSQIQAAAVGYVYGDSTCGQRALYEVGMTGLPVYNVNNNCSTGSTAIFLGANLVKGGVHDIVLALGFQKMERGSLSSKYLDRTNPMDKIFTRTTQLTQMTKAPFAPQFFGNAGVQYMKLYGAKQEHFAKIAAKNHRHSLNNPYSQFRDGHSVQTILKSAHIHGPLTKLQCCPTSDGAGAAILCNLKKVKELGLEDQAVQVLAIQMATDRKQFTDSLINLIGFTMSKEAAERAYKNAKISPSDVGVVELHDCFSANELVTYEALGLCQKGKAAEFIDKGLNTYGGKVVVNPSGGLISKGHPLGATGLAQCCELVWQLRGIAEKRQVKDVRVALQHNIGLGGACVVAIYKKLRQGKSKGSSDPAVLQKLQQGERGSL